MAIFLAGKAVCYRILTFFCCGKLHFKCESADLLILYPILPTVSHTKFKNTHTVIPAQAGIHF